MKGEGGANHDELDTIKGKLTQVASVLPPLLHFLGRLRLLKYIASKRRLIKLQSKHMSNINLVLSFLLRAKNGIDMNYCSFRQPSIRY